VAIEADTIADGSDEQNAPRGAHLSRKIDTREQDEQESRESEENGDGIEHHFECPGAAGVTMAWKEHPDSLDEKV
jgi:hypothetical protein